MVKKIPALMYNTRKEVDHDYVMKGRDDMTV
jgi:hypothetical protein